MSEARSWEPSRAAVAERRVVVLEADTMQRAATERLLRREDYWVVASSDPGAVLRMAAGLGDRRDPRRAVAGPARGGAALAAPARRRRSSAACPPASTTATPCCGRSRSTRPARASPSSRSGTTPAAEPASAGRFAVVDFVPSPLRVERARRGPRHRLPRRRAARADARDRGRARVGGAAAVQRRRRPRCARRSSSTPTRPSAELVADCLLRHGFAVHQAGTSSRGAAPRRRAPAVARDHRDRRCPTRAACGCARACAPTACCGARRSSSSRTATTATRATRRSRPGPTSSCRSRRRSREMLIRLELLLKRFGEIEAGAEHGSQPARRHRARRRARRAADLPPQPAHGRARRAPRQRLRPGRLPPGRDRRRRSAPTTRARP